MTNQPEKQRNRHDISVLMPAYNAALTLGRAVKSVIEQPLVNVELVIIDDCSTDNTLEIAKNFAQRYTNVKVVSREANGRIAAALNSGAEQADGRYFMRLDTDDWLERGALMKLQAALDTHPQVGFVYGGRKYYGRRSDTYTPAPYNKDHFNYHNASGYAYMFRREVWDMGIRWQSLGTFGGAVIDMEDWQHEHLMLAAGFEGMALPETLVLHYTFRWDGTWAELQVNKDEALAEFKRRFPAVKAVSL